MSSDAEIPVVYCREGEIIFETSLPKAHLEIVTELLEAQGIEVRPT